MPPTATSLVPQLRTRCDAHHKNHFAADEVVEQGGRESCPASAAIPFLAGQHSRASLRLGPLLVTAVLGLTVTAFMTMRFPSTRVNRAALSPEVLEPIRCQLRVTHGVLDVLVPEPGL
jgi:hypothetical protein